jgi:hypothetical protein
VVKGSAQLGSRARDAGIIDPQRGAIAAHRSQHRREAVSFRREAESSAGAAAVRAASLTAEHRPILPPAALALAVAIVAVLVCHATGRAVAPPAAAAAASGAAASLLRAGPAGYRVGAFHDSLRARNEAQRLTASFEPGGVVIGSGAMTVRLSLRRVAGGTPVRAIAAAAPRAQGNRVSYVRRGLIEWYVNGPFGVEQGFTLERPAARVSGDVTLSIAVAGNARALLSEDRRSVTFVRAGAPALRYTGLRASDASGRALPAELSLRRGLLVVHLDAQGARYPLRIDPLIAQSQTLTGSEELGTGYFGNAVALSADGNTALVGAPYDGNTGAVWVFTRSGSTWSPQSGKLLGAGENGEGAFGASVALSADGNTALIGAPYDGIAGAAWVFTRSGSAWTQQGEKLTAAGAVGEAQFGSSVTLSADGNTALVGGPYDSKTGAAWAFARSGSSWAQQGEKLLGPGTGGEEAGFGTGVALSGDGNSALIGAPYSAGAGAAWLFARAGGTFVAQGEKLAGAGESGEGGFGASVALSADAGTALIGGPYDAKTGAAWVFARSGAGAAWTQQGEKLIGVGENGEGAFGSSTALSADGTFALVGAPDDNSQSGSSWAFGRSGATWTQQGAELLATGAGERSARAWRCPPTAAPR